MTLMKSWLGLLWISIWLAPVSILLGQVEVELNIEQEQFLPKEDMMVGVRITNFSGQTLRFGRDNRWVKFSVENKEGLLVQQLGQVPVEGEFAVESSQVATRKVNLAPYFDMKKPGRYYITASVFLSEWDKQISTARKGVNVMTGTTMWKRKVGIPDTGGEGTPPEMRTYALQQAIHLRRVKLYVRISDPRREEIIRTFSLGPMVSFNQPEAQVDRKSNLHVLYQYHQRSYKYFVIDPEGEVEVRQTHLYTNSRPTLKINQKDEIVIVGGARRISADDIPPYTASRQRSTEEPTADP
jgi:hypothetical protein